LQKGYGGELHGPIHTGALNNADRACKCGACREQTANENSSTPNLYQQEGKHHKQ